MINQSRIATSGTHRLLFGVTSHSKYQLWIYHTNEIVRLIVNAYMETHNQHVTTSSYQIHGKTITFITDFRENIPLVYQQKQTIVLPTRAYIQTMGI
jgi:aromatic ring-opening dioxygenase LigB subunit